MQENGQKGKPKKKQVISGERSIGIMGSRDLLVLKLVIGVMGGFNFHAP